MMRQQHLVMQMEMLHTHSLQLLVTGYAMSMLEMHDVCRYYNTCCYRDTKWYDDVTTGDDITLQTLVG